VHLEVLEEPVHLQPLRVQLQTMLAAVVAAVIPQLDRQVQEEQAAVVRVGRLF
jgi:hypothetical protein